MAQRTLKIYIEDQLYKEVTVEADPAGGYSVAEVLAIITQDQANGLLDNWPNYNPQHLSIRIELRNR